MLELTRANLRSRIAQNTLALYAALLANVVIPLATVPYLTRVLHPDGWGAVAVAQALVLLGALVIEYGFNMSATREVARLREDAPALARLFASVLGARLALSAVVVGGACLARWSVPVLRQHPELVWFSLCWAVAQGARPYWYFQGLERLRPIAALDIAAKGVAGLGVFLLVRNAGDGWIVIALQSGAATVVSAVMFALAWSGLAWQWPRPRACWETLRAGSAVFLFRGAVSLYSVGNVFVLGALAPVAAVGYYAGAERIVRLAIGAFDPLSQALYPRFSQLSATNRAVAARFARLACLALGAMGVVMSLLLLLTAPTLIPLLLGSDFEPSVTTLRVLALLPVEVGLSSALAYYWMLPLRMDRELLLIAILTGLVNVGGALVLASRYLQNGMAAALVLAELFALAAIMLTLTYRQSNPLIPIRVATPVAHGASE